MRTPSVSVCPLSTSEPVDRFSRNLVWALYHWRTPQPCKFL